MAAMRVFWIFLSLWMVLVTNPSPAAERVALVVGNNGYRHAQQLANPVRDARAVTAALRQVGFEVTTLEDAGVEKFYEGIEAFKRSAAGAKVGLVYYAGHGIEVDGKNWLLPVDAQLANPAQLRTQAVSLDTVLGDMVAARLPVKAVILDCCRDNPLGRSWRRTRSAGSGRVAARWLRAV